MRVLIACESSGIVRDAFARRGHYALSCDLLKSETPGNHYQGDVLDIISDGWDLMIAHPPCTYICVSGMHWTKRGLREPKLTDHAISFVSVLMKANIPRIAIENPVSIISTRIRKPDQIIQPYQFGHNASKKTCLWLKNLPQLKPTNRVVGRVIGGKERFANQTDSGQNRLPPSANRWSDRSKTYEGIAEAMAEQWSGILDFQYKLF